MADSVEYEPLLNSDNTEVKVRVQTASADTVETHTIGGVTAQDEIPLHQ